MSKAKRSAEQAAPSHEELESLWERHGGHPVDFAADVLERWGNWPKGALGQGGYLAPENDA